MTDTKSDVATVARAVICGAGTLARFCDRAEHNEGVDRVVVTDAGAALRAAALSALQNRRLDPIAAYGTRLARIEGRHPLGGSGLFDADEALRQAKTWRAVQQCQARHDSVYHPDVCGLAKIEQLRHYTLHLAKLAWLLSETPAERTDSDDTADRITDVLVFGVKLATVCGQLLPETSVDIPE